MLLVEHLSRGGDARRHVVNPVSVAIEVVVAVPVRSWHPRRHAAQSAAVSIAVGKRSAAKRNHIALEESMIYNNFQSACTTKL